MEPVSLDFLDCLRQPMSSEGETGGRRLTSEAWPVSDLSDSLETDSKTVRIERNPRKAAALKTILLKNSVGEIHCHLLGYTCSMLI